MDIIISQYKLFNDNDLFLDYVITNNIIVYDKITDPYYLINADFYSPEDLLFKYNDDNIRIAFLNTGDVIKAVRVNIDNIYDYISTASIIPDNEIICGEQIQYLADIVVGSTNSLVFNPNNYKYSKQLTSIDDFINYGNIKSIFVFTHDLYNLNNIYDLSDKIIISHNSDDEVNKPIKCKLHLCQNNIIKKNKNMLTLPIGIENTQWFDHDIFHKIRKMRIKKTKDVYFFFNLNTHPSRYKCYEELKDKLEWNTKKNKENYFIELAKHKYAICPRGNGLDTHRIWECLYLDVIPIIVDDINISNLPIINISNWSDYNNKFTKIFNNQYLSKLTLKYYKNIIKIL